MAGAPEAYYFLAFVPQNFKFDGHFHTLKVKLIPKEKLDVQARRGYYAPLARRITGGRGQARY